MVEPSLRGFQSYYMEYLEEKIQQAFVNIAEVKDGYLEQEDRIVEKVKKQPRGVPYRTTLVDEVYTMMYNYIKMIDG